MMSGWSSRNENLPQRSTAADFRGTLETSPPRKRGPRLLRHGFPLARERPLVALGGSRRRGGALGAAAFTRRRLGGLRPGGLGRPRRAAGHDVADLVGVDGFP